MHFLFTFYSWTKSYLIFNEKDFEQDFLSLWKMTVLLSLLTQSELHGIYISRKCMKLFWLEVCLPVSPHRLRKIKQLTLSQDNWLWEAVTPSFRRDFRPPEDLLTLLLAKCSVKAPLKPLSSVYSGKTWQYCKHLEVVFSFHISLYSRHATTSPVQAHMCACTSSQEICTGTYLLLKLCHLAHFHQGIISGIMRFYVQEFHTENHRFLVMILKHQQKSFFLPVLLQTKPSQHSSSPNEWFFTKVWEQLSSPLVDAQVLCRHREART